MRPRKFSTEKIIIKLREAEVLISQGMDVDVDKSVTIIISHDGANGYVPKRLIMGIGTFNKNLLDDECKIYKSKSNNINDFIFFSYNEIIKEKEYVKAIQRALD
ncbi:hypothetical protein E3V55_07465 [Candidatus Marinimicrobia bacterium MT.SAG.3]|nr:hypothetical protein E3V55_07465 [Candidatus Marinimicrobia bacterium MT.SAG.3]